MTIRLNANVWQHVMPRFLTPSELGRVAACDRFFWELLRRPAVWKRIVLSHAGEPFETLGSSLEAHDVDWRNIATSLWPHIPLIRRQVALLCLARCAALPPAHVEAVSFFLYVHWTGERRAGAQKMVRLGVAADEVQVNLVGGTVMMYARADLPLVSYGWNGVQSQCDLVMVNRRVPGNRRTLCEFDPLSGGGRRSAQRNVNVAAGSSRPGFLLEMFVSTPSRAQYQQMGKHVSGDEAFFFNLAPRNAGMTHAEAKHFSSSDVDRRLRESTAGLPNVAAGGARDVFVEVPIDVLAAEVFQIKEEPREDEP